MGAKAYNEAPVGAIAVCNYMGLKDITCLATFYGPARGIHIRLCTYTDTKIYGQTHSK